MYSGPKNKRIVTVAAEEVKIKIVLNEHFEMIPYQHTKLDSLSYFKKEKKSQNLENSSIKII